MSSPKRFGRVLAAALAVCAVGSLTASAAGTADRASAYWIVLGSDRDGTLRPYGVRPDGSRLTPILPVGRALTPLAVSRDGGAIAYADEAFGLYVSRSEGRFLRRVAQAFYTHVRPALSPDGRLVAYRSLSAPGIWIVGADGRERRRLTRSGDDPNWSPDGRALVVINGASVVIRPLQGAARTVVRGAFLERPAWSPDGRWIAYVSSAEQPSKAGLWVVRPDGRERHRISRKVPSTFAWAPGSSSLAYTGDRAVGIVGVDGRRPRALRLDLTQVSTVAWSPDGRRLLLAGHAGGDPDQIWTVGVDGRGLRRLTSAGTNVLVGWTRVAPRLRPAPPPPTSVRVAGATTVATRAPVTDLSADGSRVAFIPGRTKTDCAHVAVWTPATRSLVRVSSRLPAPCQSTGTVDYTVYGVELAGSRVAWTDVRGCGNSCDVALHWAGISAPSRLVKYGNGGGGAGDGELLDFQVRGDGDLLVFNDAGSTGWRLVRIGSGDERCEGTVCATLGRGAGAGFVDSVSGALVAVREPAAVSVVDAQTKLVRSFPFARGQVRAARLDGNHLVVARAGVIESYAVTSGAAEIQRTLPAGFELVDADGGIAVLRSATTVMLLRLADGHALALKPGGEPVAELEAAGLYYAYWTADGTGRVTFMPRAEVAARLAA